MRASACAGHVAEAGAFHQRLDQRGLLQQRELRGQLEGLLAGLQAARQAQHAAGGVVAALAVDGVVVGGHHAHAVLLHEPQQQPFGQRPPWPRASAASFSAAMSSGSKWFWCAKKKSRTTSKGMGRLREKSPRPSPKLGGHRSPALHGLLVAAVQREQRARHGGHLRGDLAQLGQGDGFAAGVVGQRVAHAGDEACLFVFGELLHVDAERAADLQQHGHGERALVLLDLVEVAGRQAQRLRQRHLRQAALGAQLAQAHAHEGLAHRVAPGSNGHRKQPVC
jgi:hypothetical protein